MLHFAGKSDPRLRGPTRGPARREGCGEGAGCRASSLGPGCHSSPEAPRLISWAWLSQLPNRPAGQGPGCSGEAPSPSRLTLPAVNSPAQGSHATAL